jgi:hypothetical protein
MICDCNELQSWVGQDMLKQIYDKPSTLADIGITNVPNAKIYKLVPGLAATVTPNDTKRKQLETITTNPSVLDDDLHVGSLIQSTHNLAPSQHVDCVYVG